MKKCLEEFKAFALKGNMMDMAIGVLIGGAFSTLVTSLTDNIINPIIGILFQTDFSDVVLHLPFDINLGIGAFISAVINFIILALTISSAISVSRIRDSADVVFSTTLSKFAIVCSKRF